MTGSADSLATKRSVVIGGTLARCLVVFGYVAASICLSLVIKDGELSYLWRFFKGALEALAFREAMIIAERAYGAPIPIIEARTEAGNRRVRASVFAVCFGLIVWSVASSSDPLGVACRQLPLFAAVTSGPVWSFFRSPLTLGPGGAVYTCLAFFYTARYCECVFQPIIADEAVEWMDVMIALEKEQISTRRLLLATKESWLRVRCTGRLLWAAGLRPFLDLVEKIIPRV